MHTFYWGDWHREHTVGPVLSDNISPTGWCLRRGMKFTTHHDAPVAFPDSMRVLDATVNPETLDQIKVTETIKEGVTVFSLNETKNSGAQLRPGSHSELAFARAMFIFADNTGHKHQSHVHSNLCLCGATSKIAAAIGRGEGI